MPRKPKINLEKVKAALNTICTKCGYAIPPDRIRRIDSEQIECLECGQRFTPGEQLRLSRDFSSRSSAEHDSTPPLCGHLQCATDNLLAHG
jgi:RNA polymerase-binding transcription factor DksA